MISPVVITIWETNDYIVAVGIICRAKNILIHDGNQALNRTGSLICRIGFQLGSDHHNIANCLMAICSGY